MSNEDLEYENHYKLRRKVARATNAMHAVAKNDSANLGDKIGDVKFANIGAVLTTIKAALQDEGVSLNQPFTITENDPPVMRVDTILTDAETGAYIMYSGPGFPVKGDPQAAGGAITYFRRYSLVSLFGLSVEDDDGKQATHIERNPTGRTVEEAEIRAIIGGLTADQRAEFIHEFKEEFHMGLSELSTDRHEDALRWTTLMWAPSQDTATTEETP